MQGRFYFFLQTSLPKKTIWNSCKQNLHEKIYSLLFLQPKPLSLHNTKDLSFISSWSSSHHHCIPQNNNFLVKTSCAPSMLKSFNPKTKKKLKKGQKLHRVLTDLSLTHADSHQEKNPTSLFHQKNSRNSSNKTNHINLVTHIICTDKFSKPQPLCMYLCMYIYMCV